jgi:hypothetical protein
MVAPASGSRTHPKIVTACPPNSHTIACTKRGHHSPAASRRPFASRRGRARALSRAGPRVAARAAAPSDPAMPLDGGNRGRSDASTANVANRSRHCPGGGPECRRRCSRRRRPRARQRRPSRPRQHRISSPSRAAPPPWLSQRERRLVPVGRSVTLGRIRRRRRVLACDSGTIATWAARHQTIRGGRGFFLSGSLATMAPGMRYAIGMRQAFPGRQVIAYVGDGGFAMLMAEFPTEIQHQLLREGSHQQQLGWPDAVRADGCRLPLAGRPLPEVRS